MDFETWMQLVDIQLISLCGMDSNMLPDYEYYFDWEADMSPRESAEEAMEYAKTF